MCRLQCHVLNVQCHVLNVQSAVSRAKCAVSRAKCAGAHLEFVYSYWRKSDQIKLAFSVHFENNLDRYYLTFNLN